MADAEDLYPAMPGNENFTTNMTSANQSQMMPYLFFMKVVSASTMFKVGASIPTYVNPVILPIGFIGNILSIVVFRLRKGDVHSCHVYMTTVAVVDNMTIICSIIGNIFVLILKMSRGFTRSNVTLEKLYKSIIIYSNLKENMSILMLPTEHMT